MPHDPDVAIIGGGPIGLSASIALEEIGYRVHVFERRPLHTGIDDRRILALSEGSRLILERLGVWRQIGSVSPIKRIHVSDVRHRTRVTLGATESGVPAMGYVTTFNALHAALSARVAERGAMTVRYGEDAVIAETQSDGVRLQLSGGSTATLGAALAIHAEGAAQGSGKEMRIKDYGQWAIVAEVWSDRPAADEAFEHFTEQGPVALLPVDGHYALIWTVPVALHQSLLDADDDTFCTRLSDVVGEFVGPLTQVSRRGAFPLSMRVASAIAGPRSVFLGNAAQQLHPVAAQGFNLGLRDVWTLRECLWNRPADPGNAATLARYARLRQADRRSSLWITDSMIEVFGSTNPLVRAGRGLALRTLGAVTPLRSAFARRMMFGAS